MRDRGNNVKKHLILGNGGAAISAVKSIRAVNLEDKITIVSKEGCCAYSPVFTTYYLSGKIGADNMFICDYTFYQRNKVETALDKRAAKVDTKLRKVYTDRDEQFEYDDLLIATGSSPIVPSIKGVDLPSIFTLYTAYDAERILSFLETRERVAIIGAGLIGMQALGALTARGKKVLLVEMADQILPQILDVQGAKIMEERLYQEEVGIHLNETVLGFHANDAKIVISLASGAELLTDAVILAVGVRPNVDFLRSSSVGLNKGVVINSHCRTNIDGVYAAGDVAESRDAITGSYTINATWPNAIEQGRVAGSNMVGIKTSVLSNVRFNILSLFGFSCVSVGLIKADGTKLDEVVSDDGGVYRKLLFKDGLLVGAVLLGRIDEAAIIATLIQRRSLFPDMYDELLRHSIHSHSAMEYYWSTLFRLKNR